MNSTSKSRAATTMVKKQQLEEKVHKTQEHRKEGITCGTNRRRFARPVEEGTVFTEEKDEDKDCQGR